MGQISIGRISLFFFTLLSITGDSPPATLLYIDAIREIKGGVHERWRNWHGSDPVHARSIAQHRIPSERACERGAHVSDCQSS